MVAASRREAGLGSMFGTGVRVRGLVEDQATFCETRGAGKNSERMRTKRKASERRWWQYGHSAHVAAQCSRPFGVKGKRQGEEASVP